MIIRVVDDMLKPFDPEEREKVERALAATDFFAEREGIFYRKKWYSKYKLKDIFPRVDE